MKKRIFPIFMALAALLLAVTPALALFTNGNFETGDFSGWTPSHFLNYGLTGSAPFTGASIVRTSGGSNQSVMMGPATTLSQTDTNAPVKYPAYGQYTARINGPTTGNLSASYVQTDTWEAGDVDSSDGEYHLRFVYAAVMQDPGHAPDEQPWFYVSVKNTTDGSTLYDKFSYVGDVNNWQTGTTSGWKYLDWIVVDVIDPNADDGDVIEIEVIAADCSLGGHAGYVYLDEVGSTLPAPIIAASAPATTTNGATLQYTITHQTVIAATNVVISIPIPANTTYNAASVSDAACSESGGIITCNYASLPANNNSSFTFDVTVSNSDPGPFTLTNYSIKADGTSLNIGPNVVTTIPNVAPVANNDSYSTHFNTALNGSTVLGNDTDGDSDPLTAVLDSGPTSASAFTLNSDGTFTYTPNTGYTGSDSFTYHANDGSVDSNIATVTINVTNTAPTASNDSYSTPYNTTLNGTTVLVNDSDADSDPLTAVLDSGPTNASAFTLNSNGTFTYTPNTGYTGSDSFTYHVNDGLANSASATVTITVDAQICTWATFASVAADDGWVLETGFKTNTPLKAVNDLNIALGDSKAGGLYRSFLSFNTATLPDNALIDQARVKLTQKATEGSNPMQQAVFGKVQLDIRSGFFGGPTGQALATTDWNAAASATKVGILQPFINPNGYNMGPLTAAAFPHLNKTGFTQFRLYFDGSATDNDIADWINFYGENAANPLRRPLLDVHYCLP